MRERQVTSAAERRGAGQRVDWLPRAILSGFVATMAMMFAFIVAYAASTLLAGIPLADRPGAQALGEWFAALTDNVLIDVALPNLYAAMAMHFTVGLIFAVVYAYFFEPRIGGPSWQRGLVFSLLPWLLSLVVFLPLVGGGFFGFALGAGPLPMIGNLILHLAYGVVLGGLYGPLGDVTDPSLQREPYTEEDLLAMRASEQMAAKGIVFGFVFGLVVGGGAFVLAHISPDDAILGLHPLLFLVSTALLGAGFGALIGSLVGLPSAARTY